MNNIFGRAVEIKELRDALSVHAEGAIPSVRNTIRPEFERLAAQDRAAQDAYLSAEIHKVASEARELPDEEIFSLLLRPIR